MQTLSRQTLSSRRCRSLCKKQAQRLKKNLKAGTSRHVPDERKSKRYKKKIRYFIISLSIIAHLKLSVKGFEKNSVVKEQKFAKKLKPCTRSVLFFPFCALFPPTKSFLRFCLEKSKNGKGTVAVSRRAAPFLPSTTRESHRSLFPVTLRIEMGSVVIPFRNPPVPLHGRFVL